MRLRVGALLLLVSCNSILGLSDDFHLAQVAGAAGVTMTGGAAGSGGSAGGVAAAGKGNGAGGLAAGAGGSSGADAQGGAGDSGLGDSGAAGSPSGATGGTPSTGGVGGAGGKGGGSKGGSGGRGGTGGSSGGGTTCGDGTREAGEACDDDNDVSGDGCSATCTVESHWVCDDGMPTACRRPSCVGMTGTECGGGDCCETISMTGGSFTQGRGTATEVIASVSAFALDRYEVTVGRFRAFVADYDAWHVTHPVINEGENPNVGSGSGWDDIWTLPADATTLVDAGIKCDAAYQTWVDGSGEDTLPINCVEWYVAFAFCIWDGGRLPTESEWEYAAAGGDNEYLYPWGDTPVPTDLQDSTTSLASYNCLADGSAPDDCTALDILTVGSLPDGRGFFGHDDLSGSMAEWVFDSFDAYPPGPLDDYAAINGTTDRSLRGGDWEYPASYLTAAYRGHTMPKARRIFGGVRCARDP